jgi:hypothetical protein
MFRLNRYLPFTDSERMTRTRRMLGYGPLQAWSGGCRFQKLVDHVFPHEALPEVLRVATELTGSFHLAA